MKRISMILGTLCLGLTLSGQPGIVSTREANPQDGKVLTMEETILSSELTPENLHSAWNGTTLILHKDGKWQEYDIKSGEYKEFKASASPKMSAYTKGQSLWLCPFFYCKHKGFNGILLIWRGDFI